MRTILESVVEIGTGNKAYIPGFRIGGKTATSEKLPRRSGKYIASFCAFAPAEKPQVITLVLIDEPKGVYYGGQVAGPVMKEILANSLPYLGIEPIYNENEQKMKGIGTFTVENYVGQNVDKLRQKLTKNNINYVYELPLRLKGYGTVKPDFTVLNKRTRQEYVWEHFGMMDDSIYVKNAIKKIEQYGKSGYVQGRNFIATFESKDAPLNTVTINRVIQDFFQ